MNENLFEHSFVWKNNSNNRVKFMPCK